MAKERLTVGVDICPVILGINIFVETGAIINECVFKGKIDLILLILQEKLIIGDLDSVVQELQVRLTHIFAIYFYLWNFLALEINEKIFVLKKIKFGIKMTPEVFFSTWKSNFEIVLHIRYLKLSVMRVFLTDR